jgi:DNA-binding NtrC family response regulator
MTGNKKFKILLIDDEEETRELLKRFIERYGYEVLTASNGREGFEWLAQENIGIIFCDIQMPEMDGIEFLQKVRQHNHRVRVVMVTGNPNLDVCLQSAAQDACQFLIKPVSREAIMESIVQAERQLISRSAS